MQSLWLRASLGAPVVGTEPACVRRTPSREKTLATGAVVKSLRGRRDVLLAGSALAGPFLTCGPSQVRCPAAFPVALGPVVASPSSCVRSANGRCMQGASEAVNSAWGAITGTQPDLYFPSSFAGDWEVCMPHKTHSNALLGQTRSARHDNPARSSFGACGLLQRDDSCSGQPVPVFTKGW